MSGGLKYGIITLVQMHTESIGRKMRLLRISIMAVVGALLCFVFSVPTFSQEPIKSGSTELNLLKPQLVFSTFPDSGAGIVFKRVLVEAYDRLGYEVVIKEYPAERALIMSNSGGVDGEAGRINVIERSYKKLIRIPIPIFYARTVVFTKRTDIVLADGWDSLQPYTLGVLIGYKHAEKMTAHMKRILTPTFTNLLTMVEEGRIDLAVVSLFDGLKTLQALRFSDLHPLDPPLGVLPMYHYLNEKHADLVPAVEKVLGDMTAEGRLEMIANEVEMELRK